MQNKKSLYGRLKKGVKNIGDNSVSGYLKRPFFTLSGNREFFAEGNINVEKYGETEIVIKVNELEISVIGRGLYMCFYNRNTIKLTGYITNILFEEN